MFADIVKQQSLMVSVHWQAKVGTNGDHEERLLLAVKTTKSENNE